MYKVLGSDSGLCRHSTLIPCTHECYDFILHIGRRRAHSSIFAATALLATATPSRLRHRPVRIAPSTQRESLQPSPSGPAVAHTARRKMASKPPRQPPRGESRKSQLHRAINTNQAALGHSMEHGVGLHHAPVKESLPLAALHLEPQ